jgi:hypothetical protein
VLVHLALDAEIRQYVLDVSLREDEIARGSTGASRYEVRKPVS